MPIKSDILIVYIHILLSQNDFHIAEIPETTIYSWNVLLFLFMKSTLQNIGQ